jgi:hypothetical protein
VASGKQTSNDGLSVHDHIIPQVVSAVRAAAGDLISKSADDSVFGKQDCAEIGEREPPVLCGLPAGIELGGLM